MWSTIGFACTRLKGTTERPLCLSLCSGAAIHPTTSCRSYTIHADKQQNMAAGIHIQHAWLGSLPSSENQCPPFSELWESQHSWKKGTVVFRENKPVQAVFFLRSGKVKLVKKDRKNHNFLLGLLKPGDSMGLQSALRNAPYTATAIALEDISVTRVETAVFLQWVAQHPDSSQHVLRLLCSELARVEDRMNSMMRTSASTRLAEVLLMLDKAYGVDSVGNLAIRLKPREYADLTNVARGTMYRLLKRFAESGLVGIQGTSVRLINREGLRHLAGA